MHTRIPIHTAVTTILALSLSFQLVHAESLPEGSVPVVNAKAGWEAFKSGDYKTTELIANQLLKKAKQSEDLATEFAALNLILASRHTQNRYSKKLLDIEYRQEAIAKQLNDGAMLAKVSNNLGYDLLTTGAAPINTAIARLEQANNYYAKTEENAGRWYTLMNLTWAYRRAGDLDKSQRMGELALAQANDIDDRHAIIETALNLAETLLAKGAIAEAGKYVEMARAKAGNKDDRDRHVFEVYAAQHQLHTDQELDEPALRAAIEALETQEIFYEMFGRAILAEYLVSIDKSELAKQQAEMVVAAQGNFVPREAVARAKKVITPRLSLTTSWVSVVGTKPQGNSN